MFLDWIASIFKYPMQWFYSFSGSYIVALILFALLVKLVFLPMSIHQQKLQIKGAKLRPRIAIIERKYAGRTDPQSRQQMQSEIMQLQQKEGYSPFSGCLPLLLQLPVIMGIYQVIRKPLTFLLDISNETVTQLIERVQAQVGGLEAYQNMNFNSLMDDQISLMRIIRENNTNISDIFSRELPDLTIFGGAIDLGQTPGFTANSWPLLLIPVLTFVLAFLSMKITRKLNPQPTAQTADAAASTKIMDISMPLMSTVFTFAIPAAVGFYWVLGYVYGMIQTVCLAKFMPLPKFTEEELRQYEKEMKASKAISRQAMAQQARVKSRHHIDDDDYDSAPLPPSQKKKPASKAAQIEAAPQKKEQK